MQNTLFLDLIQPHLQWQTDWEYLFPYVYLNSISTDFEEMKKIRNAISHISIESDRAFKGLVRTKLGSLPPNISTSLFLNTTIPGTATTFFIYYRDVVVNAISNISNPA